MPGRVPAAMCARRTKKAGSSTTVHTIPQKKQVTCRSPSLRLIMLKVSWLFVGRRCERAPWVPGHLPRPFHARLGTQQNPAGLGPQPSRAPTPAQQCMRPALPYAFSRAASRSRTLGLSALEVTVVKRVGNCRNAVNFASWRQ
jgi:hypothetical protein